MIVGSRAIIVNKERILLIHRFKNGKEYYVLPGGAIEKDESPENAAIREVKEETNLDIELGPLLSKSNEMVNGEERLGYYFLADQFSGELKLGSPEFERQSENNVYLLEWVPFAQLTNILFYPEEIKKIIIAKYQ
jgi:8-oxo-dGTP diphosphatase